MTEPITGDGFKDIFYNSEAPMLIIATDAPLYTMLDVNNAYLQATYTTRQDLIGKPVFGVFPANPTDEVSKNIERTIFSFEQAIQNKQSHTMRNYRYDIPIPGTGNFEERYWTTSNTPVMDEQGTVLYFIHSPSNVTELYKLGEREKAGLVALQQQQEQLYSTFMQAPVGIIIFKGADYIVDLINPPMCELYGKTEKELLGKPIFDVLVHSKGQGFEELLDNVRLTGQPFKGVALPVSFQRNGMVETAYLNFVYEPFRETDGTISGVIAVATEVTDLVNAKNKIEETEARARLAVDAVGLGTFDLDLISGEMITSKQFANIFGFDEPVPRSEYVKVFHTGDLDLRNRAHQDAIISGQLLYEARVIWKDKSIRWVRVEGKVLYDDEGKVYRILGIILDITEQRNARENQQKLITLVDNSVDLVCILDLDGVNSYMNAAGCILLGYTDENEVAQIPISKLQAQNHFDLFESEIIPTVITEGKWAGTMMVRHLQTGEVFPVYNNCFRIDDPVSGMPISIGAVMRDMRPELAAKQALEDSEQLLRNITDATPIALWMSDEEGAFTYINKTWLDWSGQNYVENLGDGWQQVVIEKDRERVVKKLETALHEKISYEAEFRIHHSDGTVHWCIANGQPQYRSDGSFSGYIGACVDISEQKALQQQKDDFIGIASHELKTPVTSIKGYAQILEKMLLKKGDEKEAMMMGRMDNQIKRLTSLINDLLDVTKINSGKLQFNYLAFEFNGMVKEMVEDLQRTTENHTLQEELGEPVIVYGDKERIGQVITNLISNAIKYSPDSEKIVIRTSRKDNEVILSVVDYGIGIPADKLEKVFEQFYRVSGDMQHTFPGLGLGLYISSEIIKRVNGRIWVTSREGEGSVFCIALPVLKNENYHEQTKENTDRR